MTEITRHNKFAPPMRIAEKKKRFLYTARCITYVYSVSSSDYTACKAEKFLLFLEIQYRSSASKRYHATKKLGIRPARAKPS